MRRVLLLLCVIVAVSSVSFSPLDKKIFHTANNWAVTGQQLWTANPGAYIKLSITGTTQVTLQLVPSALKSPYATVAWYFNGGQQSEATLPATQIVLATGLKPTETYHLFLFLKNSLQSQDRWIDGPATRFSITGFTVDDKATLLPTPLASRTMLAYWDSIGEGVAVYSKGGDLAGNDASVTWAYSLARAIDAELSLVAWGYQGYTHMGNGNVPVLWNANGASNSSAWRWQDRNTLRDFSTCPDLIFNGHGTNDGYQPASTVMPFVRGWMSSMRAQCPKSQIFMVVPFGLYQQESITLAYKSYVSDTKDQNVRLIQLGDRGAFGLRRTLSFCSDDGVHPRSWCSSQLGAQLAVAVAPYLK